jgi:RNA polymerase sigma-70 factor (ECF subfamily)
MGVSNRTKPADRCNDSASTSENEDVDDLVALMIDYQAGRLEAFEDLYASLAPQLRRHFSRTGYGGLDLVQETFLEIHRSRHTYTPPLPVGPWAFGVARNVERRHWRRHRLRGARLVALESAPTPVAPGSDREPVIPAADVEKALRQVPPAGRDAWWMHHVQGLTFPEIATRLRIETNAARLRAHRAMVVLRTALGVGRGGRDE